MLNQFIGKGNLADAPQSQYIITKNSTNPLLRVDMRVMFDRYKRSPSGEIERVGGFWRNVEMYGNKAEELVIHLRKGARVLVIGEEQEFVHTDIEGRKTQRFKIIADEVALILSRIESIIFAAPRYKLSQSQEPSDTDVSAIEPENASVE
jgi:single-strand DNA-binding protein